MTIDEKFMKAAYRQAVLAAKDDEVPVGAVVVKDGKIISRGRNKRNGSRSAIAHAEISAIEKACKKIGDWRLNDCVLYVTLEPCLMCAGACFNARLQKVVFGAYDSSGSGATAAIGSKNNMLNHNLEFVGGVLAEECSRLLGDYFASKRK